MSIRTKILVPLLGFILLAAIVSGLLGQQSSAGHAALAETAAKALAASDASRLARDAFDRSERVVTQVMAMTDFTSPASIRKTFEAASAATGSNLASLKAAAQSRAMLALAQATTEGFEAWRTDAEALLGLRPSTQISALDVLSRRGEKIRTGLNQAVSTAGKDALARIDEAGADMRRQLTLLFSGAGLTALLAIAGAFRLATSLSKPLVQLVGSAERLAAGDVSVEIAGRDRADEIGGISRAVEVFRGNVMAQLDAEAQAAQQRQRADGERNANEAARLAMQQQQITMVASIASGLDQLSKGDLTSRLDSAFAAEYEKLRTDFNAAAASLQTALSTIALATNGIDGGSDQIAQASDDLSRRTEQQAASLEETAAALNVIAETVKDMAANAGAAAKLVVTTRDAAEASGSVVREAIEAMGKIKDSSDEISKIIGVIDEIAFQTSLLALNAGVEAARAGDAGRGFAVVASEVRGLAQRSAEAAKEIKTLISASTVQVLSGVGLVDRTGAALKDINAKVADMERLVRDISNASQDQATGIAEINTAINQMNEVVQSNAAMVEESTAAAYTLKNETQELTTMVGRFQLGDTGWKEKTSAHPVHAAQAKLAREVRPAARSFGGNRMGAAR